MQAPSTPIDAVWFDGLATDRHPAQVRLEGTQLHVQVGDTLHTHPASALALPEPARGADRPVGLPDGSTLWLPAAAADEWLPRLQQAAGRPARAVALIGSWPAVLVSLALLVAGLVWFHLQGAGLAAQAVLPLVPRTVDERIGDAAWPQIEKRWLAQTRHGPRCAALQARLAAINAQHFKVQPLVLSCHRTQEAAGFNAFALPNGRIVLFDGLLEAMDDDEAMAVLGHELGHVVHRHTMQALVRSFGLAAVAGVALGDFSTVAVTATTTLQGLAYSRDAEREADAFALEFMARAQIPTAVLRRVWRKFAAEEHRSGGGVPPWLSSHPSTQERIEAVERTK